MYWNEAAECSSREHLEKLQLERLQGLVERVYRQVPFYRNRLEEAGIGPEDIRTLDDLQKNPLHHKGRPSRQLSFRPLRRSDG